MIKMCLYDKNVVGINGCFFETCDSEIVRVCVCLCDSEWERVFESGSEKKRERDREWSLSEILDGIKDEC